MASGHPDWGQGQASLLLATISDLGELAARLGSPSTFSRTGNILYQTEFNEGAVDWTLSPVGTGSSAASVVGGAYRDGVRVGLVSGSRIGDITSMSKVFIPPFLTNAGAEAGLAFGSATGLYYLELIGTTGASGVQAGIRYDLTNRVLQYHDAANGWTTFAADVRLFQNAAAYHVFKLTLNLSTLEYVRALVDNTVYDLSGIAAYTPASGVFAQISIQAKVEAQAAANTTLSVDSVFFTINEP